MKTFRWPTLGRSFRGCAMIWLLLAALCLTGAGRVVRQPAVARADSVVQITASPQPDNKFPAEVDFSLDATSSAADITEVQLHYVLLPSGTESSARAQFDKGPSVHAVYQMRTAGNPLYLPPTKHLRYFWTVQDASGNQQQTDPVEWSYDDTRFKFKTASNGNLTLYYYTGTDANAQHILSIGRAALDKAAALDGAPLDFPIHLAVYRTQADVQPALSHEAKSVDPNILGQADPPDIVVLVAGDLSGAENEDTVRHELTHLVNARSVQGPYQSSLPIWLDEGLAVFSQNQPTGFDDAVATAIRRDAVVPLRSLTPSLRGSDPGLFYGEAWSVVSYLVKTSGDAKMAQLLAAFKGGSTEDAAFTSVYGMDRDGVYNAWRKSVGLNPVAPAPTRAAQPNSQAPATQPAAGGQSNGNAAQQPTQAPAPPPGRSPSRSSDSSGADPALVIVLAVGGGALFLALLGGIIFAGLALSRRARN